MEFSSETTEALSELIVLVLTVAKIWIGLVAFLICGIVAWIIYALFFD